MCYTDAAHGIGKCFGCFHGFVYIPENVLLRSENELQLPIFNYSYRMMVINTRSLCSLQTYVDNIVKRDFISRQNEKEANQLCDGYYLANRETKEALLRYIASRYCVSKTHAMSTVNNFLESKDRQEDYNGLMAIDKLRDSLTPRYLTLIDQIGRLEDGVKFLVDIRSDLINIISDSPLDKSAKIELRSLSNHIKELLSLWFSVGFLSLERMTWNSPSSMLQKLSDYEAVHPMRNWIDLKRRVGPYRRCYVFTHSCLPREPLVILHVALMQSIATSIQNIIQRTQSESLSHHDEETLASLDLYAVKKEDPNQINAAIFYSISSTQRGLHGIELGNQLIKRVVREIRSEFPQITQFSSLSPIPNFNEYLFLELQLMQKGEKEPLFTPDEFFCLKKHLIGKDHHDSELWSILLRQLKSNSWIHDDKLIELLRAPLMRKCAHYLYAEKRRGFALNSVAHFHLRNGAVLWRLNWLADVTPRGLTNSCGMMVNYRYFLENTENNSHLYTEDRFVVASEQLLNLIKPYTSAL